MRPRWTRSRLFIPQSVLSAACELEVVGAKGILDTNASTDRVGLEMSLTKRLRQLILIHAHRVPLPRGRPAAAGERATVHTGDQLGADLQPRCRDRSSAVPPPHPRRKSSRALNMDLVWNQDVKNFIVAARTYLPRLLDRIEKLERSRGASTRRTTVALAEHGS